MKKSTHTDNEDSYENDPFALGSDYKIGDPITGERLKTLGLPSPAKVAASLRTSKITLALDSNAIEFFKAQAKKHNVPYQAMIRSVVSDYVAHHSQ